MSSLAKTIILCIIYLANAKANANFHIFFKWYKFSKWGKLLLIKKCQKYHWAECTSLMPQKSSKKVGFYCSKPHKSPWEKVKVHIWNPNVSSRICRSSSLFLGRDAWESVFSPFSSLLPFKRMSTKGVCYICKLPSWCHTRENSME